MAGALVEAGHAPVLVGIDTEGGWHLVEGRDGSLAAAGPPVRLEVPTGMLKSPGGTVEVDAVFPVLHGPFGEDGTVQGLLEVVGLPYVGAGVFSSAAAMDKDVAKRLFRLAGLPVADYLAVRRGDWDGDPGRVITDIVETVGFPAFVKPASLGSSVGIARVEDEPDAKHALEHAFTFGPKAVVEEAVTGREIEVAVLEGPRTSVPGEIVPVGGWYDYRAKYHDDATRLLVPAPLGEGEVAVVRTLAARAFEVLEIDGLARVDFFYEQGGRGFLVNEVNTMPGFTPRSMFPLLWQATGISYPDLVDELVRLALD